MDQVGGLALAREARVVPEVLLALVTKAAGLSKAVGLASALVARVMAIATEEVVQGQLKSGVASEVCLARLEISMALMMTVAMLVSALVAKVEGRAGKEGMR